MRKPYVVYNVVLGNQILPDEVARLKRQGYLEGGTWTQAHVAAHYPQLIDGAEIDERRLLDLRRQDQIALGEVLFQYHCNDCHAAAIGYSAVGPLLQGRSATRVDDLVEHLDEEHFFMPPWCGTPEEARVLTAYLMTIAPPRPAWMLPRDDELEKGAVTWIQTR